MPLEKPPEKKEKERKDESLASFAAATAKRAVVRQAAVAAARGALAAAPTASAGGASQGILSAASGLLAGFSPVAAVAIIGVSLAAVSYNFIHAPASDGIDEADSFQSRIAPAEHESGRAPVNSEDADGTAEPSGASPGDSRQPATGPAPDADASAAFHSGPMGGASSVPQAAPPSRRSLASAAGSNSSAASPAFAGNSSTNAPPPAGENTARAASLGSSGANASHELARALEGRLTPMSRQRFSRTAAGASAVSSRGSGNGVRGLRSATYQRLYRMNGAMQPTTTMANPEQASAAQTAQWTGSPVPGRSTPGPGGAAQFGPSGAAPSRSSGYGSAGQTAFASPPPITNVGNSTPHQDLIDLAQKLILAAGLLMLIMTFIKLFNKPGTPNYELFQGILKTLAAAVVAMSATVAVVGGFLMADGQMQQGLMFTSSAVLMGVLAAMELMPTDNPTPPPQALEENAANIKADALADQPPPLKNSIEADVPATSPNEASSSVHEMEQPAAESPSESKMPSTADLDRNTPATADKFPNTVRADSTQMKSWTSMHNDMFNSAQACEEQTGQACGLQEKGVLLENNDNGGYKVVAEGQADGHVSNSGVTQQVNYDPNKLVELDPSNIRASHTHPVNGVQSFADDAIGNIDTVLPNGDVYSSYRPANLPPLDTTAQQVRFQELVDAGEGQHVDVLNNGQDPKTIEMKIKYYPKLLEENVANGDLVVYKGSLRDPIMTRWYGPS